MDGRVLYTICVVGAVGLYLLLRHGRPVLTAVGALLGLAAAAGLFIEAARAFGDRIGDRPGVFFAIFALVAIVSAVTMITHRRPVYSALYFVLVVLSSAGLFLLLEAEFMAFALIIVYAGAILITYLFVIMLAQQAPDPDVPGGQPEYDVRAREPAAAAVVGFIMLSLLSHMVASGLRDGPTPPSAAEARMLAWRDLEMMPTQLRGYVEASGEAEAFSLGWSNAADALAFSGDDVALRYTIDATGEERAVMLDESDMPENIQRVGLGLIVRFRDGQLELAGVILLMAMFGAVVLARKQIELSDDEKREAAGMTRHGHEDDAVGGAETGGAPQ